MNKDIIFNTDERHVVKCTDVNLFVFQVSQKSIRPFNTFFHMTLASNMIKQRQEIIRFAEDSELGWKVVDKYMQSEIASDEKD